MSPARRADGCEVQDPTADARTWGWPRWAVAVLSVALVGACTALAQVTSDRVGRPEWVATVWAVALCLVAVGVVSTIRGERLARRAALVLGAQSLDGALDVRVSVRTSPYFVGPPPRRTSRLRVDAGELRLGDDEGGYLWPAGTWTAEPAPGWSGGIAVDTPNGQLRVGLLPPGDLASLGAGQVDAALAAALGRLRQEPRPVPA